MHERYSIIDTFPEFLEFWKSVRSLPLDYQIDAWANLYGQMWPEILRKQVGDYIEQGIDWRQVAAARIFPFIDERLPEMRKVHDQLVYLLPHLLARAKATLGFATEINFVLYVGIGCGAGWATTYAERPAILFGLENLVESGWTTPPILSGMVAHKLGHIAHQHWRTQTGKAMGTGPWWQLYEEGFAQRCEHLVQGKETWHMAYGKVGWTLWCLSNVGQLAHEFLRRVDAGESMQPLFGSWYDIDGWQQTGYFLGHTIIRALEEQYSLLEIALLEDVESQLRPVVEALARRPE
ncbi:MAG: hypothetical protein ACLFU8_03305 [Anaerolineales bacterium]